MALPDFADHTPVDTPYSRAREEWDTRRGSLLAQARNWRLVALGNALVALLLGGGLITQAQQSPIVPYIVEVDTLGQVRSVGRLTTTRYEPSRAAIQHTLTRFVLGVRALSTDPVVVRQQWLSAYHLVTPKARPMLDAYAREFDPFAKVGTLAIAVEVHSVLALTKDSYEVQWAETVYRQGQALTKESYSGIFTVTVQAPRTDEELTTNPLGIYLDHWQWTRKGS
jgi:type IV secretion system protein VirB5